MPTEQFNIRLGAELARQVRVRAAQLGCRPRDVIAEALETAFGMTAAATAAPDRLTPVAERLEELAADLRRLGS